MRLKDGDFIEVTAGDVGKRKVVFRYREGEEESTSVGEGGRQVEVFLTQPPVPLPQPDGAPDHVSPPLDVWVELEREGGREDEKDESDESVQDLTDHPYFRFRSFLCVDGRLVLRRLKRKEKIKKDEGDDRGEMEGDDRRGVEGNDRGEMEGDSRGEMKGDDRMEMEGDNREENEDDKIMHSQ
uniref:Uncharacterized protein n=1 Tax=Chromera velia CCMP2878 TaxID=1169474 RepID=A0A0G4HGE7_9ALVE|eukprot:Cvel_27186.t1-p1 / transcript=Cvel_27186.t1 / gene=Cvel_27186 / organism=Chromera_velia_CCMP2878 / gene_product=hypothetical protein / transcript_product=hypothetical protein / location=Cvel_scaffold3354:13394-13939(+) / protein_length=182 / sequence_SO=supercontig / SO=protein_coding / is_pseudo=false